METEIVIVASGEPEYCCCCARTPAREGKLRRVSSTNPSGRTTALCWKGCPDGVLSPAAAAPAAGTIPAVPERCRCSTTCLLFPISGSISTAIPALRYSVPQLLSILGSGFAVLPQRLAEPGTKPEAILLLYFQHQYQSRDATTTKSSSLSSRLGLAQGGGELPYATIPTGVPTDLSATSIPATSASATEETASTRPGISTFVLPAARAAKGAAAAAAAAAGTRHIKVQLPVYELHSRP